MSRAVVYECAACGVATRAIVGDLPEPDTLISKRSQTTLRELDAMQRRLGQETSGDPVARMEDDVLDSLAKRQLRAATCPHCSARNPSGVAQQQMEVRRVRVIGTISSVVAAIGAWFVPWIAYIVVTLVVGMLVLTTVVSLRGGVLRWTSVAFNVAILVLALAAAWLEPRAIAVLPALLAVRFPFHRGHDYRWTRASETIRFELPA